jgi:RNA polymerase sigma-70 factor (ECF subfamily)
MARAFPRRRADLTRLADEELLELAGQARPEAFELVYDRHCTAAFSLAYRICGTRTAAEEVTQDAFLAVWRGVARYDRTRGSVRTWLLGIVHNRAIDALRRHAVRERHRTSDEALSERLEAPQRTEAEALRREQAREVRGMLDGLPSEQRQVIELAYFAGFTHSEIAQMLDLAPGTVKGRMRLGLEKLREPLAGAGPLEVRT